MIAAEDLSLFRVTDSVEETVDEVLRFYRVFDRMEYVDNRLVLRLREQIADSQLADLPARLRRYPDRRHVSPGNRFDFEWIACVCETFEADLSFQPPQPRSIEAAHRRDQRCVRS